MIYIAKEVGGTVPEWKQVPMHVAGIHGSMAQGLYVFVFRNKSPNDVIDNNKKAKIVIRRQGVSLKPGKFEQTLLWRLHSFNTHLREPRSPQEIELVFFDCLVGGYVLDLSSVATEYCAARVFERYWLEGINHFLDREKVLAPEQLSRAEWRYLDPARWTSDVEDKLRAYVHTLGEQIVHMASHARFPGDNGQ
jgi:hypothetical protein